MKKTPAHNSSLLEIHVPDFDVVRDFYGKIGFEVVWGKEPEEKKGYLVMKLENNILCFWPGNESVWEQSYFKNFPKDTKRGYGIEIVVMVEDIEALYEKMSKFANIVSDYKLQPWGLWDFRIEDPFGYFLRFTSNHDILDRDNAIK